jgi:hypothetical protein
MRRVHSRLARTTGASVIASKILHDRKMTQKNASAGGISRLQSMIRRGPDYSRAIPHRGRGEPFV